MSEPLTNEARLSRIEADLEAHPWSKAMVREFGERLFKVEAQLATATALLREVEWAGCDICDGDSVCLECGARASYDSRSGVKSGAHAPDCRLAALLTAPAVSAPTGSASTPEE